MMGRIFGGIFGADIRSIFGGDQDAFGEDSDAGIAGNLLTVVPL